MIAMDAERRDAEIVVLAGMAVSDMERATRWYATLLGRGPDAEPMPGLAEWRAPGGTIQIVLDSDRAGGSLLTVQVPDLHRFVADLATRGGPALTVDGTSSSNVLLTTTTDPDSNAIALVQVRDGVDL